MVLVALAVLVFALGDSLTKWLTMRYSVAAVMFVRYALNLMILAAVYGPRHGAKLWRTQRSFLVALRGLCLCAASISIGLAFRTIPVGEATAIVFLAPFAVMLLAGPLLGEKVGLAGWVAALAAFCGVLLILRPGGALDPAGALLAVSCATFSIGYQFLTRYLARTETTMALLFTTALTGTLVFGVLTMLDGAPVLPDAVGSAVLLTLGLLATLGHFLFTAGYREAPAALLSPVNYTQLFWAVIFGWAIFGHLPDRWSAAGMVVVLLAGASVALRARKM